MTLLKSIELLLTQRKLLRVPLLSRLIMTSMGATCETRCHFLYHFPRSLLNSSQVRRIYLDELGNPDEQRVGISLMQLTIASESQMVEQAKRLIERVQSEETTILPKDDIIDLVTTIAVYKFANLSREEVEAMLGVNLEETRVYQQAKAEGREEGREEGRDEGREEGREELKLELVPRMLARGMTQEEVAELLGLAIAQVRLVAQEESQE